MLDSIHIAIDASRTTSARVTGTEHYARALLSAVLEINTRHTITLYFRDDAPDGLFAANYLTQFRTVPFPRAWTHIRFAREIWMSRPDVTFVPAHTLPFVFPGPAVVTVHDLGYKRHPTAHKKLSRWYLDWTTRFSAWRATYTLADSAATARDLSHFYRTPESKINIVFPGVDAPSIVDVDVRKKYVLPDRYFLFVGTLQPRKNIQRIVEAYIQYRKQTPRPAGLVLAGARGWLFDPKWVEGVEGVVLPGYIDESDKGALYAGAVSLVFPSLYEGFGFPIIEAMHCGTPVIASNSSSLPELVGDAGILVDPHMSDSIRDALMLLDRDSGLRHDLCEKGFLQANKFTWVRAAQQTLAVLERAAKG